jgi:hypothetical protein
VLADAILALQSEWRMAAPLQKPDILTALRALTAKTVLRRQDLSGAEGQFSPYGPINQYLLMLGQQTKPETASEHLFRSLIEDLVGSVTFPQVNIGVGYVDFILPETGSTPVLLELKPLFTRYDAEELRSHKLNPRTHLEQVKKYLCKHEYVILTDLRDAYLYSARDTFVEDTFFCELPFAELLERHAQSRNLYDVLRRAEDEIEKPELDRLFFEDLDQWIREFAPVRFLQPERAGELVILLINKLIFAKTLEDYGLIPFRFLQDRYDSEKTDWEAKGPTAYIRTFLQRIEEWLDEHYDTELFEERIWKQLDKSPANLERFSQKLDLLLGVAKWDRVFHRGLVHYNYRRINEDIFGKSYEMFLAANRKDEGIYYTPAPITTPMANSLVEALFAPLVGQIVALLGPDRHDFAAAEPLLRQLYQIRVVDMAGGSGGFQIKVLRAVWQQYRRIVDACAWSRQVRQDRQELFDLPPEVLHAADFRQRHLLQEQQHRELVAAILLRHIWCVDKDPGALEVAKTNIWKEAVKLSPEDYNFRVLKADAAKILPNLELNFLCADSLVDVDLAQQTAWLAEHRRADIARLHDLRDRYVAKPSDHAPLQEALKLRAELRQAMAEQFKEENLPCPPLLAALNFFPCYVASDGTPLPADAQGFDGNIGNPPWGNAKPVRKEFAQRNYKDVPGLGKYAMDATEFEAWFATKLKEDADCRARWEQYQADFAAYKDYLNHQFHHQGTGDWNYFKLFLENNLTLLKTGGRLVILVPSGIQTDEGCAALRKLLTTEHTLLEITSFENKGYTAKVNGDEKHVKIFPDVHPQYKFGFLKIVKGVPTPRDHAFDARFYLHDPAEITSPPVRYSVERMRQFSPENLSLMEFRSERDYELCAKIRAEHPLLGDLGYQFRREFHVTEDSHFFHKRRADSLKTGHLLLFEGKMIFQFDSGYAPGTYYVVEKEVREELLRKEIFRLGQFVRESGSDVLEGEPLPVPKEDLESKLRQIFKAKEFRLHYEVERLAYRAIGRTTDERTLIASVLKPRVCLTHSLYYLTPVSYALGARGLLTQDIVEQQTSLLLTALFNSLLMNYYVRSKVSANLNISSIEELPIPKLADKLRAKLVAAAEKLLASPHDTKERARLEVLVAREVYDLDAADWQHLTGTFTYGSGDTKAELDEIIARSRELW